MSNKKNLKGLAVACAFALGSTLISGMPAQAYTGQLKATDLTLTPATGSKYSVPVGTSFLFESSVDADLVREDDLTDEDGVAVLYGDYAPDLTYAIFNPDNLLVEVNTGTSQLGEADVDFHEDGWDDSYSDYFYGTSDDADEISSEDTDEIYNSYDSDYIAVTPVWDIWNDVDSTRAYIDQGAVSSDSSNQNILEIDSEDAGSLEVVAFMDENDNGRIDSTEYVSTKRTVTFVSTNEEDSVHVTATATIDELELESVTADVSVTLNQDVNSQLVAVEDYWNEDASLGAFLTKNGTVLPLTGDTYYWDEDAAELYFDYEDGVFHLAADLTSAATAGSYRAQVLMYGDEISSLSAVYSLAAGTSADVYGVSFDGPAASANTYTTHEDEDQLDEDSYTNVRSGTKNVTLTGTVVDSSSDAIEEKTRVRVTVGIDSLDDSTTITVGGKTLNNDTVGGEVTFETTSSADGTFPVAISSDKALDGDDIYVYAAALSTTGWESDSDDAEVYWEDAYINNVYVDENRAYSDDAIAIKADSTFTLNFAVVDQFGEPWTKADHRVTVYETEPEVEMGASKVISAGKAAVSLTDNDTTNSSSYDLDFKVEYKNTSGNWVAYVDGDDYTGDVTVYTQPATASTITAVANASTDVSYTEFANADFRADFNFERSSLEYYNSEDGIWVDGYVRDSLGVPVPGELVTVSAPGDVLFYAFTEDGDIQAKSSIVVRTDSSGYYGVYFAAHNTGDVVISVKSGSATATDTVEVLASSVVFDEDSTVIVTSTGKVGPGSISGLSVKLADKWGNADDSDNTDVVITVAGNAYVINGSLTTTDGVASTTLIMGAAAKGATITAKAEYAEGEYVSKVVSLGKASASIKGLTKQVRVNVSNAAGKTVKVFVDGKKKSTVVATAAVQSILVPAKAGSHKVVVRINGVVTNTKTRTVK